MLMYGSRWYKPWGLFRQPSLVVVVRRFLVLCDTFDEAGLRNGGGVMGRLRFSLFSSSFSWQFYDRAAHIWASHTVVLWWLRNPKLILNWMLCFVLVPLASNLTLSDF